MKKSALLAVSALSLGVVGLATFTPVVNAATTTNTTATVSVTVANTVAIGSEGGNFDAGALDVNLALNANDKKEQLVNVRTLNNTGSNGTLTLKATDSADLSGAGTATGQSIPASATEPTAGHAGWGFKGADDVYHQPSTTETTVSNGELKGDATTEVTFIAATGVAQMNGTYSTGVTYTFTAGS